MCVLIAGRLTVGQTQMPSCNMKPSWNRCLLLLLLISSPSDTDSAGHHQGWKQSASVEMIEPCRQH